MTDLVGKAKYSINTELWGAPKRAGEYNDLPALDSAYAFKGMTFLRYGDHGFVDKDTLKIALGKAWTEEYTNPEDKSAPPVLTSHAEPLKLFYGRPLMVDACGTGDANGWYPGFWGDVPDLDLHFSIQAVYTERISVYVDGLKGFTPEEREKGLHEGELSKLDEWAAFIKLGLNEEGKIFHPIAHSGPGPQAQFHDCVYKSVDPFTPKEMNSKQPFGKAAQVSLKTYYNTSLDSKKWESFVAGLGPGVFGYTPTEKEHMEYNNVLPTPYGFLRVMLNKFEVGDLYKDNLSSWAPSKFATTNSKFSERPEFVNYPYELLMTFLGRVPETKIAKLVDIHPKTENVQDQFEEYFESYMEALTGKKYNPKTGLMEEASVWFKTEINQSSRRIDQVFNNIAISPSVLKNLDKVQQIKKYFPYYVETEFSTTQYTELGDMIKQVLFGKYFVNKIAGYNTYAYPTYEGSLESAEPVGAPKQLFFSDYRQEKTFDDLKTPDVTFNIGEVTETSKNYYNIINDLNGYANGSTNDEIADGIDPSVIQNHIAYLRDDIAEPIDVNEFNSIWKKVLGTALSIKLDKTYKKHHRTYQDLLDGKPAYTEDIAYKISKYAKKPGQEDDKYILSQNIIVPNTSDINLFNYIDTQLKYGTDMIYKYKIYAIKIVFGCQYQYFWPDLDDEFGKLDLAFLSDASMASGSPPTAAELGAADVHQGSVSATGIARLGHTGLIEDTDAEGGVKGWTADLGVTIHPKVVMLEDLFYESPEIIISDHPPVAPDANIVPYRGKSDKILILLNGMMDTYRDYPIEILPTDASNFDFIKRAQLTPDKKIKFSSDDPVKSFQIFRTKNKPSSYTDFELYSTIAETHIVDKVKPNQKYYYTFRAIDGHGHISNPTAVYEVELIDDHGSVKPLIRIFNFEEPKYFEAIKECQKYLMIKPNLKQLYYNPKKGMADHSQLIDYMFNGSSDTGLVRMFKLRITSKSTGKKIDLNIKFSRKEVEEDT